MELENIDKIYVISLRDRIDRRKIVNESLNNLGIKYQFIDAWNAKLSQNIFFYNQVVDKIKLMPT